MNHAVTCACGKPGRLRQLEHNGQPYTVQDPCEECAEANAQRLRLLGAAAATPAELFRLLLEQPS